MSSGAIQQTSSSAKESLSKSLNLDQKKNLASNQYSLLQLEHPLQSSEKYDYAYLQTLRMIFWGSTKHALHDNLSGEGLLWKQMQILKLSCPSPFENRDVLCIFGFLSDSRCCPFPLPSSFLVTVVSLDPIYCCVHSFGPRFFFFPYQLFARW